MATHTPQDPKDNILRKGGWWGGGGGGRLVLLATCGSGGFHPIHQSSARPSTFVLVFQRPFTSTTVASPSSYLIAPSA